MYKSTINPRSISGILEDIFHQGITRTSEVINTLGHAPVNILETENEYDLSLVAPGLNKEAFKINLDKNVLSISFEQPAETTDTTGKWLRKEYKTRSFKRSFNLNDKIDTNGIAAKYTDGILHLTLPKKAESETKSQEIVVA
jgi:HSP20 family protein